MLSTALYQDKKYDAEKLILFLSILVLYSEFINSIKQIIVFINNSGMQLEIGYSIS